MDHIYDGCRWVNLLTNGFMTSQETLNDNTLEIYQCYSFDCVEKLRKKKEVLLIDVCDTEGSRPLYTLQEGSRPLCKQLF